MESARMTRTSMALAALMIAATIPFIAPARATAMGAQAGAPIDQKRQSREDVVISNNAEFDEAHGVRSGSGSRSDPYVISGWIVNNLIIRNTSRHVMIMNNEVRNQMILDWIGHVHAHNNTVNDLRVNQNVERSGPMTSGVIAHNKFSVVGQLRHWDGVFEKNVVGSKDALVKVPGFRAVNFDGFNGARFRDNTIYGYVDVKLHGHHHSSDFGKGSHDHYESKDPSHGHGATGHVDHSKRHHELFFSGNEIHSDHVWALRYYDRAHTADDRTAASETNKLLNCPHVHFTKIHLTRNKLLGSGLMIDVFNAFDENHWSTKRGLIEIAGNQIDLSRDAQEIYGGRFGIIVQEATDVDLKIRDNRIDGPDMLGEDHDLLDLERKLNKGAGILLVKITEARVWILDNWVAYRAFGIEAAQFEKVQWWVRSLQTIGVDQDINKDDSVPRPGG